jgi:hypothetical protein
MAKKIVFWEIVAVIVLILALLAGINNLWQGKIVHDYPTGYMAQDGYIFFSNQYWLNESRSWHYIAPALVRGETNIIQAQPPIFYHISATLANLAGIEFYDSSYITVMLLILCTALCFYYIIRAYNPHIALLSLPFNVLLFSGVWLLAFAWGRLPFFTGCAMLMLCLWCMCKYQENKMIILFGIIAFASVAMAHTSEYMLLIPLVLIFLRKEVYKMLIIGSLIASPYLLIFINTFLKGSSLQFITPETTGLSLFVTVLSAGWIIAIIIGLGLLFGMKHVKSKPAFIGYYFFVVGFTYFIGFGKRAIETRYVWTIYLSVFFGMFFYEIFRKFESDKHHWYAMISIVLTCILAFSFYTPLNAPSIITKPTWDAIRWISTQTPKDSTILFYGDFWQAGALFSAQRITDIVTVESLQNFGRFVNVNTVNDRNCDFPVRTGIFSFGSRLNETKFAGTIRGDVCSYDYHAIRRLEMNRPAINWLVDKGFTPVFENSEMMIVKGEC